MKPSLHTLLLQFCLFLLLPLSAGAYYSPEQGRWLNRDPAGESQGMNVYANVSNDLVGNVDYLGLGPVISGKCLCLEKDWLRRDWHRGCYVARQISFSACVGKALGVERASQLLDCIRNFCGYGKQFKVNCLDSCPSRVGKPIARGLGSTITICRDQYYSQSRLERGATFIHEFLHLDACGALRHRRGGYQPGNEPDFDAVEDCFQKAASEYPPADHL